MYTYIILNLKFKIVFRKYRKVLLCCFLLEKYAKKVLLVFTYICICYIQLCMFVGKSILLRTYCYCWRTPSNACHRCTHIHFPKNICISRKSSCMQMKVKRKLLPTQLAYFTESFAYNSCKDMQIASIYLLLWRIVQKVMSLVKLASWMGTIAVAAHKSA